MLQTTLELRPVNAAAVGKQWPMAMMEAIFKTTSTLPIWTSVQDTGNDRCLPACMNRAE